MAITSGASPGVVVTTAAVNEAIPAQTNVADATLEVEVSDDITTLSNGNLEATPSYVGRLIILRQGDSTPTPVEETRLIVSAAASGVGNTWILGISEPWDNNPATSDTIHVSYIIQDAATLTGLGLITKRVQDYSSTRRFTIGTGAATFAYFALLFGASLETTDNSSTTVADFTVESDGRFDSGYLSGDGASFDTGVAVSGGQLFFTPAVDGELAFEAISGAEVNLYDFFGASVKRPNFDLNASATGKLRIKKATLKFFQDIFMLIDDTEVDGLSLESDGTGTTPILQIAKFDVDNFKNVVYVGHGGLDADTNVEFHVLKGWTFVDVEPYITLETTDVWQMVNPVWDTTPLDSTIFVFNNAAEVQELISLNATIKNSVGTGLQAKFYVVADDWRSTSGPGTGTQRQMSEDTAAASTGIVDLVVEVNRYLDGTTVVLERPSDLHAMIVANYGQKPVIREYDPDPNGGIGDIQSFTLLDDNFQVETTRLTAMNLGDVTNIVTFETQTNDAIILRYTAGSGTLTVGDIIDTSANAWSGTVLAILEGDSVAGTILVDTTNTTAFSNVAQTLDDSPSAGDWSATYTLGTLRLFTYLVDCDTLTIQQMYDWFNSKLAQPFLDGAPPNDMDIPMFWSNQGPEPLPIKGEVEGVVNTFKTLHNANKQEGWFFYNMTGGLANYAEAESNDGTPFVPDNTVSVTLTVKDVNGNAIEDARCRIENTGGGLKVNGVTNASGIYTDGFSNSALLDVNVIVRRKGYIPFRTTATIQAADSTFTLGITLIRDQNVNLP